MNRYIVAIIFLILSCVPTRKTWKNEYRGGEEDAFLSDDDFGCLQGHTKIDHSYYSNSNGHLEETLQVARDPKGKEFPVGTVVQLFPGEAMVKRHKGFSEISNDWEYFVLEVHKGKTYIKERGTQIRNIAGSCNGCHHIADEYDFVCFEERGCKKLPFFALSIAKREVQKDSRCR